MWISFSLVRKHVISVFQENYFATYVKANHLIKTCSMLNIHFLLIFRGCVIDFNESAFHGNKNYSPWQGPQNLPSKLGNSYATICKQTLWLSMCLVSLHILCKAVLLYNLYIYTYLDWSYQSKSFYRCSICLIIGKKISIDIYNVIFGHLHAGIEHWIHNDKLHLDELGTV